MQMTATGYPLTMGVLAALLVLVVYSFSAGRHDAYILVRDDAVTAEWGYKQLPMKECAWCHRTVNLNRHHVIPQSANPALRDVPENLIVLCRDCHFVLGHRCDWKQYNPDVMYICSHFTNVLRSAYTRYAVTNRTDTGLVSDRPPGISPPNTTENKGPSSGLDESVNTEQELVHPPAPIDATPVLHVTNDVPKQQQSALERILKWDMEK